MGLKPKIGRPKLENKKPRSTINKDSYKRAKRTAVAAKHRRQHLLGHLWRMWREEVMLRRAIEKLRHKLDGVFDGPSMLEKPRANFLRSRTPTRTGSETPIPVSIVTDMGP